MSIYSSFLSVSLSLYDLIFFSTHMWWWPKKSLSRTWKIRGTYDRWASTAFNRHPSPIRSVCLTVYHSRCPSAFDARLFFRPIFTPSTPLRYATDAHSCEHRTNSVWGNWWTSGTRHPEIGWKSDKKRKKMLVVYKRIDIGEKESERHSFHHLFYYIILDDWHHIVGRLTRTIACLFTRLHKCVYFQKNEGNVLSHYRYDSYDEVADF